MKDNSVRQRLTASLEHGTRSERSLATYMLANLNTLPFETAATLATKVKVSEPSVGRFCRSIGYRHFKALKADLQADPGGALGRPQGIRLRRERERRRRTRERGGPGGQGLRGEKRATEKGGKDRHRRATEDRPREGG